MEYCPEGTLEQLVTSSESGLSECLVRRFTRQLLQVSLPAHCLGLRTSWYMRQAGLSVNSYLGLFEAYVRLLHLKKLSHATAL
jgi:serine/threonine protein kinase